MERLILDTNIIVSAIFWKGTSARLLEFIENNNLEIVVTTKILNEYIKTAFRLDIIKKTKLAEREILLALNKIINMSTYELSETEIKLARDPKDDKFLEAAVDGKCKFIISYDKDLLDINVYKGIKIMKPEDFLSTAYHT